MGPCVVSASKSGTTWPSCSDISKPPGKSCSSETANSTPGSEDPGLRAISSPAQNAVALPPGIRARTVVGQVALEHALALAGPDRSALLRPAVSRPGPHRSRQRRSHLFVRRRDDAEGRRLADAEVHPE